MKDYPLYPHQPFDTLREMLDRSARHFPEREALAWEKKKQRVAVTFLQLQQEVRRLGAWLMGHYAPESHIALLGGNSHEWIVAHLAVTYVGMVIVPFDKDMPLADVLDQMDRSDSVMIFLSEDYADHRESLTSAGHDVVMMRQIAEECTADV